MIGFEEASGVIREWDRGADNSAAKAALVERYPFLSMRPRYRAEEAGCNVAAMSCIPDGWRIAFGAEMLEDLRTVLLAAGGKEALGAYHIDEVKEKYGELRWYSSLPGDVEDEAREWISRVEELYCSIAGRTCIVCGSMEGVRLTDGWVSPLCPKEGELALTDLDPIAREGEFCVWERHNPDGASIRMSYKDMCAGVEAPILAALGLAEPLRVTGVWNRLCEAQEG